MKTKLAIAAVVLVSFVATASADSPPQPTGRPADVDAMTRAMTPGPRQALLTRMAGEWNRTVKLQHDPSRPAQEFPGTATVTALLGGRYIQENVSSRMGDAPYDGVALFGFDNVSGQYVGTMIDNMGTGFTSCAGTADSSGNVIRWEVHMNDPASGKPVTMRMVTTVTDDDHHTLEMFAVSADGKRERRLVTIEYVRKH